MVFSGEMIGENSLFQKENLNNISVKALDDCLFFIISKDSVINFIERSIFSEWDLSSSLINMHFSNFSLFFLLKLYNLGAFSQENKEKLIIKSIKQNILGEEAEKIERGANECLLKEKQKYFFFETFKMKMKKIRSILKLQKILKYNKLFSYFDVNEINDMAPKFEIREYLVSEEISFQMNKIYAIIKGKINVN